MKELPNYSKNDIVNGYNYQLLKSFYKEDIYDDESNEFLYTEIWIEFETYTMLNDGNIIVNNLTHPLSINGKILVANSSQEIRDNFTKYLTNKDLAQYNNNYMQYLIEQNNLEIDKVSKNYKTVKKGKIEFPHSQDYCALEKYHQNILAKFDLWYKNNKINRPQSIDISTQSNISNRKFPHGYLTNKCLEFANKKNLLQGEPVRKYHLEELQKELEKEEYPFKKDPLAILRSTFSKKGYSKERKR